MQDETAREGPDLPGWMLAAWHRRWRLRGASILAVGVVLLALSFLERSFYASEVKLVYVDQPVVSATELLAANPVASSLKGLGLAPAGTGARLPELLRSRSLLSDLLAEEVDFEGRRVPAYQAYLRSDAASPRQRSELIHDFRTRYLQASYDVRTEVVRLQVLAPAPDLSANLANSLATRLNTRLVDKATERARRQKSFIEGRLQSVKADLDTAEQALKNFREENRAIQDSPALRMQEGRLLRAVALNEQLYSTLAAQYELAKIEEVKNLPVIDVLDEATPPYRRAKPRRAFRFAAGLVLGFLALVVFDAATYLRAMPPRRA